MERSRTVHLMRAAAAVTFLACAAWILWAQAPAAGPVTEIQMTAKKYEFTPSTIRVKTGEPVKLTITATDHEHGFKIDALHINEKLPKGKPVTIEFTPMQAGTFPFECSHFCGLGHGKMKGQLIVE
jgi:cytochrome c oxidase subunit 2